MATVVQVKRKIREIMKTLHPEGQRPNIILYMWDIDDGTGKPGFCQFNLKTQKRRSLTEQEMKEHEMGKYSEYYKNRM